MLVAPCFASAAPLQLALPVPVAIVADHFWHHHQSPLTCYSYIFPGPSPAHFSCCNPVEVRTFLLLASGFIPHPWLRALVALLEAIEKRRFAETLQFPHCGYLMLMLLSGQGGYMPKKEKSKCWWHLALLQLHLCN